LIPDPCAIWYCW